MSEQDKVKAKLDEMQERCAKAALHYGEPLLLDSERLIAALRRALETITELSDSYCGLNDMTGRNALDEIARILERK